MFTVWLISVLFRPRKYSSESQDVLREWYLCFEFDTTHKICLVKYIAFSSRIADSGTYDSIYNTISALMPPCDHSPISKGKGI